MYNFKIVKLLSTITYKIKVSKTGGGIYGYLSIPDILKQLLQPLMEKYKFLRRFF